jgi:hypothetical protein
MPFSKFIVLPIFVAVQAALLMLLAPFIKIGPESIGGPGLVTWISFQAWAMYFMGGCTVKMAGKTVIGYAGGIIASVVIFTLIGVFAGAMAGIGGPHSLYSSWSFLLCALKKSKSSTSSRHGLSEQACSSRCNSCQAPGQLPRMWKLPYLK